MMPSQYERTVFLNYPFEAPYQLMRDAITFGCIACGFIPRSAEETIGGLELRVDRIIALINQSCHSIHDLSGSVSNNPIAPRLNMPFELGLFYGAKRLGQGRHRAKNGFVFDKEANQGNKSLSDAAGLDFQPHNAEPIVALVCVQRYLKGYAGQNVIGPASLTKMFRQYLLELTSICEEYDQIPGNLSFEESRGLMSIWLARRARAPQGQRYGGTLPSKGTAPVSMGPQRP